MRRFTKRSNSRRVRDVTRCRSVILGSLRSRARAGDRSGRRAFGEALETLYRVSPRSAGAVLRNLASLENESGGPAEAERHYRQALGILEQSLGRDHVDVAATHLGLGNALRELGRTEEARGHYSTAIEIHRQALGPDAPALALDFHNLAALLLESGETKAAVEKATEAEKLSRQHFRLIAEGVSEREALIIPPDG